MSLDELYTFCLEKGKSIRFSADDEQLAFGVNVDGNLSFQNYENENSPTEGLMPVTLQACHTGTNLNGSHIEKDVMQTALNSFHNRPILGYIHEVDGEYEFYGHNMHLDDDDNVVYDEIAVGTIPESCNARIEYDEEKKKDYVVVDGYIYEDYTKAADILRKYDNCPVSVELCIRDLSFDAKEKVLKINDFFFLGVSILGKDENGNDVKPGMADSNIKISNYSKNEKSMFENTNIKLIDTLEELNKTLLRFENDQNAKEGGKKVNKLEELLAKYSKTIEDLEFSVEGLSDEELEQKFTEAFEVQTQPQKVAKYTIELNGSVKNFEISLSDKIWALEDLVNITYGDSDNTYYGVIAYDDYVIMKDYWYGKAYKQSYKQDGDDVSLVGDRTEVFAHWLTKDEEDALANMRNNYESVQNELSEYKEKELNAQKDAILADQFYAEFVNEPEFKELIKTKQNYNLEDFKDKAEIAYAKCKRRLDKNTFSKASEGSKRQKVVSPSHEENKSEPYGTLFAK